MEEYTLGTAIRFNATFRDSSGTLYDPTSAWGMMWDATSTVVASGVSLTRADTGYWYADVQTVVGSFQPGAFAFEANGLVGVLVYKRRKLVGTLV